MPHELTELRLDAVTRPASGTVHEVTADVCVVGAGIAGCSAAIESARLGRSVLLVDSLPLIGGQMVHSLIGLFAGVFGNAPGYTQLTHGIFDEIFIESVAFLPSGHGHPHELWAIRDDPASRYLRSLCFCASCLHLGAQRGIDGAQLRDFVARTLQSTWNSPLAPARDPDPGDELSGLLVARPDLAAWTAMRCDTVASLVGDLAAIAHDRGARLATGLGIFARPAPLGWIEGIDPARLAPAADRLVAMAYYAAAGAVARDLDHYSATVARRLGRGDFGGRLGWQLQFESRQ